VQGVDTGAGDEQLAIAPLATRTAPDTHTGTGTSRYLQAIVVLPFEIFSLLST